VRKAIVRGAIASVHVVELTSLSQQVEQLNTDGLDTSVASRSVRAHWRGYWDSVRLATRDADGTIVGATVSASAVSTGITRVSGSTRFSFGDLRTTS